MDDLSQRLRRTNLNLLPTLQAVLKHRNLTRAAEELHVTQAAVSNSLRQLREHFGDPLLIREGRMLRLTDQGARLVEPLDRALAALAGVLSNAPFDPLTASRIFKIATADYVTAISAPAMADTLSREAPNVRAQMVTARGRSVGDLRIGNIDMVISPRQVIEAMIFDAPRLLSDMTVEPLVCEPFVCLGRASDAALAAGLTAEAYLARAHASFVLDIDVHASIEHAYLAANDIMQFDRIQTSDFTILPMIAAQSDCLVLVPRSLGRLALSAMALQMVPPPLPVPEMELVMVWNGRRASDPELAWLRNLVSRCVIHSVQS